MLSALIAIIAILSAFGTPVAIVFIIKYFKALDKGLVGQKKPPELPPGFTETLEILEKDRDQLETRIRILEAVTHKIEATQQKLLGTSLRENNQKDLS